LAIGSGFAFGFVLSTSACSANPVMYPGLDGACLPSALRVTVCVSCTYGSESIFGE
jgi:hypothetical protein